MNGDPLTCALTDTESGDQTVIHTSRLAEMITTHITYDYSDFC